LFSAGLTILTATSAFSWGEEGHKAIWAAAQTALTPKATLMTKASIRLANLLNALLK
jgi:hypothetical protein